MLNVWLKCEGTKYISPLSAQAFRLVDTQDILATRKLVDSLEEQALLETMLDESKPPIVNKNLELHKLLFTPFRYPPLKHGSRFGKYTEYSIWYGSLKIITAMAEKAYYRFHFLNHIETEVIDYTSMHLTSFGAQVKTNKGIHLTNPPFSTYSTAISSPSSYEISQFLGTEMRNAKVEAFEYISARDPNNGINIGLFTPKVFSNKKPESKSFQSWDCIANKKIVEFIRTNAMATESYTFPIEMFLVSEELPFPAN